MTASEKHFAILDSLASPMCVLSSTGTIVYVNEAWSRFGRDNGAADAVVGGVGANYLTVCAAAEGAGNEGALEAAVAIKAVIDGALDTFARNYRCHSPTMKRWFRMEVAPSQNVPGHVVVSHVNIARPTRPAEESEEQRLEIAPSRPEERVHPRTAGLQAEQVWAEITLTSIADAVIAVDDRGSVTFINPAGELLTGWEYSKALHQPIEKVLRLLNASDRTPVDNPITRCLAEGVVVGLAADIILLGRHGSECFIQDSAAPIFGPAHEVLGAVVVFSDVSERNRLARKATYDSAHDFLTGLTNRREFEVRLWRALRAAHRDGYAHALLYIDLDQFKVVNDTAGHPAGDELLRQLSQHIDAQTRSRDTFARFGGDEFGLLLEHCSFEQAHDIAEKLRRSIADFRFTWQNQTFRLTASLGLVIIDSTSPDIAELLKRADAACYLAKAAGRNQVHTYHSIREPLDRTPERDR